MIIQSINLLLNVTKPRLGRPFQPLKMEGKIMHHHEWSARQCHWCKAKILSWGFFNYWFWNTFIFSFFQRFSHFWNAFFFWKYLFFGNIFHFSLRVSWYCAWMSTLTWIMINCRQQIFLFEERKPLSNLLPEKERSKKKWDLGSVQNRNRWKNWQVKVSCFPTFDGSILTSKTRKFQEKMLRLLFAAIHYQKVLFSWFSVHDNVFHSQAR